jgi:hypothetical protein
MFKVNPPHPCLEVEPSKYLRAAAGTGGIAATVILKTIESVMEGYDITYKDLSWKLVAQFSWLLLDRITMIDPETSGFGLYRILEDDYEPLETSQLFTRKSNQISQFLENALTEVGQEKVLKVLSSWRVLGALVKATLPSGSSS